jgi:hypothetical protein
MDEELNADSAPDPETTTEDAPPSPPPDPPPEEPADETIDLSLDEEPLTASSPPPLPLALTRDQERVRFLMTQVAANPTAGGAPMSIDGHPLEITFPAELAGRPCHFLKENGRAALFNADFISFASSHAGSYDYREAIGGTSYTRVTGKKHLIQVLQPHSPLRTNAALSSNWSSGRRTAASTVSLPADVEYRVCRQPLTFSCV